MSAHKLSEWEREREREREVRRLNDTGYDCGHPSHVEHTGLRNWWKKVINIRQPVDGYFYLPKASNSHKQHGKSAKKSQSGGTQTVNFLNRYKVLLFHPQICSTYAVCGNYWNEFFIITHNNETHTWLLPWYFFRKCDKGFSLTIL